MVALSDFFSCLFRLAVLILFSWHVGLGCFPRLPSCRKWEVVCHPLCLPACWYMQICWPYVMETRTMVSWREAFPRVTFVSSYNISLLPQPSLAAFGHEPWSLRILFFTNLCQRNPNLLSRLLQYSSGGHSCFQQQWKQEQYCHGEKLSLV